MTFARETSSWISEFTRTRTHRQPNTDVDAPANVRYGGKADIRIDAFGSRRLAQNVNGSCRQNKRRHGHERDER